MKPWFVAALVVLAGALAPLASCGPACREIETRPIALACETNSAFKGELHLDSAAVYESFLRDQCLPTAEETTLSDRVQDVDFDKDAVFVASRLRFETQRCIEERAVERVEVCEDGLRVTFVDETSTRTVCPGLWTVAFSLSRDDLRTAIAEDQP